MNILMSFIHWSAMFLAISMVSGQETATTQPANSAGGAALFTEDFESGQIDKAVWDVRTNGAAAVSVQTDKVAHGKNALAISYPATTAKNFAFISTRHLDPALKTHLFGRAYVYVDASEVPINHSVFILAGTVGFPVSNFLEIGQYKQRFQLSYQANAAGIPRGQTVYKGAEFPVGKWVCMEWEFSDKPDQTTVWLDGQQTDQTSFVYKANSDNLVKGFDELTVGFRCWGRTSAPITVYYDDIALGSQRIGPIK